VGHLGREGNEGVVVANSLEYAFVIKKRNNQEAPTASAGLDYRAKADWAELTSGLAETGLTMVEKG
jgi:hypothetical protein